MTDLNERTIRWWQPVSAGIMVLLMLCLLGKAVENDVSLAIGVSSLAASIVLVFVGPESRKARVRNILLGYIIAMSVGLVFFYLNSFLISTKEGSLFIQFCCASVGVSLCAYAMFMLDALHPPAVGITLSLILEYWHARWLLLLVFAVITLIIIRFLVFGFRV